MFIFKRKPEVKSSRLGAATTSMKYFELVNLEKHLMVTEGGDTLEAPSHS
ncbi:hypothetical protein [Clostridium estertheticum]|nr:hypothetical protein [Clostridium estertheticum]MBX4264003.1 hypothetical protein [Clostridium estertheticum]MBX4268061.1 hypothetical protein [Clostridium estertheticum]WLC80003.1 hypothetical protein KTC98_01155 [Clostridium estertheticum]WLC87112.1 hypothetical protein KTC95_13155 [Clostridium estertheticum]